MNWMKRFFKTKAFALTVSKSEKELLELFITNKNEFDEWMPLHNKTKIRFQFYYPTAIDFYYSDFKLYTAYYKKERGSVNLSELKMTETNFDTIRCSNWRPFEEIMMEFLTSLQESKKIALFEKRKMLYEYESLCSKNSSQETEVPKEYANNLNSLLPR